MPTSKKINGRHEPEGVLWSTQKLTIRFASRCYDDVQKTRIAAGNRDHSKRLDKETGRVVDTGIELSKADQQLLARIYCT